MPKSDYIIFKIHWCLLHLHRRVFIYKSWGVVSTSKTEGLVVNAPMAVTLALAFLLEHIFFDILHSYLLFVVLGLKCIFCHSTTGIPPGIAPDSNMDITGVWYVEMFHRVNLTGLLFFILSLRNVYPGLQLTLLQSTGVSQSCLKTNFQLHFLPHRRLPVQAILYF